MVHLDAIALSPALVRRWCMGQKLALTESGITGLSEAQRLTQIPAPPWQPLRIMHATTREFLGIGEIRAVPEINDEGKALPEMGNILAPKMVFSAID